MSLLIAFQNLLFKKIYFVCNEMKCSLLLLDFSYQEKYIDILSELIYEGV